ncbi:hypothetical protein [Legionella sp. CNM-4043-24]|uniref:hypothetical protein n=1 Tax=Legionella sp. CNM-4043-24 TaxID=3421646 RepID=UPI00403B31AF
MLRKIGLSLLCAGSLLASSSFAMTHDLAARISADYELDVNKPEIFTNYTMFTVKAVCTIKSIDNESVIHVKAIKRTGSINGQSLSSGDSVDIVVHNDEKITLSAQSAAQVELTNNGDHNLKALCKTV